VITRIILLNIILAATKVATLEWAPAINPIKKEEIKHTSKNNLIKLFQEISECFICATNPSLSGLQQPDGDP